jgi:hypothetical protein
VTPGASPAGGPEPRARAEHWPGGSRGFDRRHPGRGPAGGTLARGLAEEFGTPFYVYDLDLIGRRVAALRGGPAPRLPVAFAVKANPARRWSPSARCGVGRRRRLGRRARDGPAGRLRSGRRHDRARQARRGAGRRRRRGDRLHHRRIARRAAPPRRDRGRGRSAPADPAAPRRSEDARLETVRLIGGVEGKFGMPLQTLIEDGANRRRSKHVELLGVHAFGASNLRDAAQLAITWRISWRSAGGWPPRRARRCAWWTRAAAWASPTPTAIGRSTWPRLGRRLSELAAPGTRTMPCASWRSCSNRAASWSGPPAHTWPESWT